VGDLRDEHFRLIELDRNYGKGEALRIGMKAATGRYVGFIDADGDIAPELMASFAEQAARDRPDALLGSKYHPESAVHSAPLRRLLSVVWQALVKLLFQFPVSDSQAGIKLFRRDVLERALPLTTLTGFAFDLELLVVARDLGYTDLVERPIQIAERSTSTVSLGTSWRMLTDLVVIFWRTRVRPKVRNRRSTSPDGAPRGSSRRDDDVGRPPADRHRPADVSAGEVNRDDGPAL
jgi:glycosyltransferase involved in cell wall biosynthesis